MIAEALERLTMDMSPESLAVLDELLALLPLSEQVKVWRFVALHQANPAYFDSPAAYAPGWDRSTS